MTLAQSNATNFLMRIFSLISLLLISLSSLAEESVNYVGYIKKSCEKCLISIELDNHKNYELSWTSQEVAKVIHKLNDGDAVTGYAYISDSKKLLVLESIDFVGLKNLLGNWSSDNVILKFKDFSNLRIIRIDSSIIKEFSYSISPNEETNNWRLFVADNKTVSITALQFNEDHTKASITFYDSETGLPKGKVQLTKQKH